MRPRPVRSTDGQLRHTQVIETVTPISRGGAEGGGGSRRMQGSNESKRTVQKQLPRAGSTKTREEPFLETCGEARVQLID